MKIKSCDITTSLMNWVAKPMAEIVNPNYYIDRWECDVLKVTGSGHLYEYEIKVSKADFKADFNKSGRIYSFTQGASKVTKQQLILDGSRVNRFYYVVPKGLITPEEVPDKMGLIYATPFECTPPYGKPYIMYTFEIVKVAKMLNKNPLCTQKMYSHLAINLSWKLAMAKKRRY